MADHQTVVVLDTGTSVTKAGFGGEDSPRSVFPTVVGRPRHGQVIVVYNWGILLEYNKSQVPEVLPEYNSYWSKFDPQTSSQTNADQTFVGHDAITKRGVLTVKYPVEWGIVTNWDEWETLCFQTFQKELNVDIKEHGWLMVDTAIRPRVSTEKLTQMMFETFNIPYGYIAGDAAMSLLQSGRTTGIVLEAGEGATHIYPVYEGCCLRYCFGHTEVNGRSLDYYMMKLLSERGYDVYSSDYRHDRDTMKDIKETHSYVAFDFNVELQTGSDRKSIEKTYELPNGQKVTLENERFRCPELMFQPKLDGIEMPGVHEIIHNSIQKCDPDLQKDMYANIVLAGGCSLFPGVTERMSKEMTNLAPNTMEVNVTNQASVVKYQAWKGGSILASSVNFLDMCMKKDEYDEWGPNIARIKCF